MSITEQIDDQPNQEDPEFKDFDHPDEHPPQPSVDDEIAERQRFLASKLAAITIEIKSLKEQAKDAQREFRQDIDKLQESAIALAREYKNAPFVFHKHLFPTHPDPDPPPPSEPFNPYTIEGGKVHWHTGENQPEPPKTRKKRPKPDKEEQDQCQTMTPGLIDQTE